MEENGRGNSRHFYPPFSCQVSLFCEVVVQIARKIPSDEDKFREIVNKSGTHYNKSLYLQDILIANQRR